uniref:EF-hand domain-containing protein n=1 Tax=Alexandrium catenella TaxID=2925 RepID=A0A7S1QXX4_ALECA
MEGKDLEVEDSKTFCEAGKEAKASCKAAVEFIVEHRTSIEQGLLAAVPPPPAPPAIGGGPPAPPADPKGPSGEAREELLKLQARVHNCLKTIVTLTTTVQAIHLKAVQKEKALKLVEKRSITFDKYDRDKDGQLNKKEIVMYAKGEYNFSIAEGVVPKIIGKITDGGAGVPKSKFQRLRVAVGIAREEEASRVRRKKAEERAKYIAQKKTALEADIGKVADFVGEVDPEVGSAETKARPLAEGDLSTVEKVPEVLQQAEEQLKGARSQVERLREQIKSLCTDAERELVPFVNEECRKLGLKADLFDLRLGQVEAIVKKGRAYLASVEKLESEKLALDVIKALKEHLTAKKLSIEDCFAAIDADKDGHIGQADFMAYISALEGHSFDSEKLEKLFGHFTGEGKSEIGSDAFTRLLVTHYRVAKDTLITSEMAIKSGKTQRRLDVGEVFAVYEGPVKDETLGIFRVRGRALKDGCQGWATELGNTGGVFLEAGEDSGLYEVVRPQPLSAGFEPDGHPTVRYLKEGDKLEVLEWDKEHEGSGQVRIQVKLAGEDGPSGWVTKMLQDETMLVKLVWRPLKKA